MDRLFSPWRSRYITSFFHEGKEKGECVLCAAPVANDDDGRYLVHRGTTSYVVMNLYPYNSGHLMVVPYRHCADLTLLTAEETTEIMELTKRMIRALRAVSNPDGFNVGSNLGRTAGAGIDQHVHLHIVPRWSGDTNFMPVLADTKLISEDMEETLRKLRAALAAELK